MVSNEKINNIGKAVAARAGDIKLDELELLQEFRTSFSQPLVDTFNGVRVLADKVDKSSIIAFRLKRIGTILNKIEREPKMKLSRMGDIAGVRCIFNNESEVYKALKLIEAEFKVSGCPRDYIESPKPLGYRGIHVYVKDEITNRSIEIQLRTIKSHNWATLVEITDLLYDLRLKELGFESDKKFAKFHALMSSDKLLTKKETDEIYEVLNKRNFIFRLSKTFRKNNSEVKKQWSADSSNNSFFLIEASKDDVPKLRSFKTFEEAEMAYFEKYKEDDSAEIVLTSIRNANFRQISIAYANYILSYHTFINDIQPILKERAAEALENYDLIKFRKLFKTYEDLQANLLLEVLLDSADLFLSQMHRNKVKVRESTKLSKFQEKRMRKNLDEKLRKRQKLHEEFLRKLEKITPKNFVYKYLVKEFILRHNKRIQAIMLKSKAELENAFIFMKK